MTIWCTSTRPPRMSSCLSRWMTVGRACTTGTSTSSSCRIRHTSRRTRSLRTLKPKISVCCITARPGGLDVLLTGLKHQTFRDFELVLVDAVYDRRVSLVQDAATDARVAVVHTPPRVRLFPEDACPEARNTAIIKAHGELLLWVVDYAYLAPACLEAHWDMFEKT